MARPLTHSVPSDNLENVIRQHFGLTQAELARLLGISSGLVAHLEAGRRVATPTVSRRMRRLGDLLPAPDGLGPPAPAFAALAVPPAPVAEAPAQLLPDFGNLAAAPLQARLLQVAAQAAALRYTLYQAGKGDAVQQRRQWALTVLPAARPLPEADAAEHRRFDHWLQTLTADVAAATPGPAARSRRALLVVRLLGLDAETAALQQLLAA